MQINLFDLNNWKTKKFLKVIIATQLLMFTAIALDSIGSGIPFFRQAVGMIYLTFIPGMLILRLFKLHDLNPLEFILYSIGLSLSFLMFSGLFINSLYPILGFSKPLSGFSVIFSIISLISVMCILLYKLGNDTNTHVHVKDIKITKCILYFSILFPLLIVSILGTYYVNVHNNNLILLFLIFLIIILLILVGFDVFTANQIYPVAVFMITISILYSISLISRYLTGYDILWEYYFYKSVEINSIWNSYIPGVYERMLNMNSMLSVTILPLIYNKFLNIEGIWIFKIFFPFIFSFSFVGLYYVYAKQIGDKKAFFSVMLILSFIYFMSFEMLSLARQMIAQLFFVLLIILMLNQNIAKAKKYALYIIFAFSLIVSHYGLSYIYMLILISIFLIKIFKKDTLDKSFFNKNVVLFFIVLALFWYTYTSQSAVFNSIIKIGSHILTSFGTDFFSSREVNVLMALGLESTRVISPEREIHQKIQIITQIFIVIGSYLCLTNYNKYGFNRDYIFFLPVSLGLIFASIIFPYFSRETMNMTRLYQTVLLILSPFFIIGGEAFLRKLLSVRSDSRPVSKQLPLKLLILLVLIPYFAFNSGFVSEITKDDPLLTPLGIERLKTSSRDLSKAGLYDAYTPEQDIRGALWLSDHRNIDMNVYTTKSSVFLAYTASDRNVYEIYNQTRFVSGSYIYLRYINNVENIISLTTEIGELKIVNTDKKMNEIPMKKHKIYDNGGGQIFLIK